MRLAFVGKGGAGKSAIAGTFARTLARQDHKVLAIDSDPLPGLAFSLGLAIDHTPPIPDDAVLERKEGEEGPRWRLNPDVDPFEAVDRWSVEAPDGVRFLQFGKIKGDQNLWRSQIAFRFIINQLPAGRWNVVGDLPGGTRQAFTGWGSWANTILIVVEPTAKSLLSGRRLARMADLDPDNPRSSAGAKTDSYVSPEPPIGELELSNKILANYRAVFLTNVAQVNPNQADQLKRFVEQGGTLIIFGGPGINSDNYNQQLVPRGLLPGRLIKTVSTNEGAFHFDFGENGNPHPFLKEFKGQKNSGLTTAQIWTYWQIELPANTTATRVLDYQSENGKPKDPAITEHTLGRGRVVFFSTTANPDWNGLTPKPAYVTLMHEILAGSVGAADRWMNLIVGDLLNVPQSMGLTASPQLIDSSKNPVAMEAVTDQAGVTTYHSARPMTHPGIYSLSTGNRTMPIAVNVPPNEADVRVISTDAIKKALGDIDLAIEDDKVSIAGLQADSGNDWSWSVMAAVLALAGFECFCAMHFGHYKRGKRQQAMPQPASA